MKRTPQSSITALLEGVEQAKLKKEFNILKDLKTLHAQYTKINKPELALAKKYDLPCETPEDLAAIREKYMPEMVQLTAQSGLR